MRRVGTTYSVDLADKGRRSSDAAIRRRQPAARTRSETSEVRRWIPTAAAIGLSVLICVTINFRAFSEFRKESAENQKLDSQVQDLTTENLAIQEEIHSMKSDPKTVERQARKFGYERRNEKRPVPVK